LTDAVEDCRYETVRSTLERALASEELGSWTNCALVFVDERTINGERNYRVKTMASAMDLSEIVALLELAKLCQAADMGFNRGTS
jgi:hypothetical protein